MFNVLMGRRSFFRLSTTALASSLLNARVSSAATADMAIKTEHAQGYVRLFPELAPTKFAQDDLIRLARGDGADLIGMSSEPEILKNADGSQVRDAQGHLVLTATPENEQDDEENFGMAAGYSYVGQFIDHDLTLNPIDHFGSLASTSSATNLRTTAFDLDCIYGRGPADQPYLYQDDGRRLLQGRALTRAGASSAAHDHPRLNGRAILGDKRNDENVLVSQMHGVFVAFHNRVAKDYPNASFEQLRSIVTLHYQWMILTDFLPKLLEPGVLEALLPGFGLGGRVGRTQPQLTFAAGLKQGQIPVEFTDAAYRFGHSVIRSVYRLNTEMRGTEQEQSTNPGLSGRRQIFAASHYAGLNGFREYPADWAIDWKLYFEIDRKLDYKAVDQGAKRVQASYKIDTSLVNPLAYLPEFSMPGDSSAMRRDKNGHPVERSGQLANLALRNLLRGMQDQLPSGEAVARAMGIEPIAIADLKVGRANVDGLELNRSIAEYGESFRTATPLWFYILAESQYVWTQKALKLSKASVAQRNAIATRLGPVGGQLVAQTFIALMKNDPKSILNASEQWRPQYLRNGRFDMPALIVAAGLA